MIQRLFRFPALFGLSLFLSPIASVAQAPGTTGNSGGGGCDRRDRAFHTMAVYDQNCHLLSLQMKVAASDSPSPPALLEVGRGGDGNKPGINTYWYEDNLFADYATGNMIPCH